MNILRPSAYTDALRRRGTSVAIVSILTGNIAIAAACAPNDTEPSPPPTPGPSATDVKEERQPSCYLTYRQTGPRTYKFDVSVAGMRPSEYTLEDVSYYFGDGEKAEDQNSREIVYTYDRAGSFPVRATIDLDVAPGVTPPRVHDDIPCSAPNHPLTVK